MFCTNITQLGVAVGDFVVYSLFSGCPSLFASPPGNEEPRPQDVAYVNRMFVVFAYG
jgi:hypothetical protein